MCVCVCVLVVLRAPLAWHCAGSQWTRANKRLICRSVTTRVNPAQQRADVCLLNNLQQCCPEKDGQEPFFVEVTVSLRGFFRQPTELNRVPGSEGCGDSLRPQR